MSIRMSNEMRELRNKLGAALDDIDKAVASGDVEAAESAKAEADKYRNLLTIAENAFEARKGIEADPDDGKNPEGNADGETEYNAKLFYKAISGQKLTDSEKEVINSAITEYRDKYSEGSKKDGGYTVPDDLSQTIFEGIKSKESVRNLVSVENVTSATGTRIWRKGDANKLYNTEEYAEIKEMNNAEYEPKTYKQHKFAGLMTVSSKLWKTALLRLRRRSETGFLTRQESPKITRYYMVSAARSIVRVLYPQRALIRRSAHLRRLQLTFSVQYICRSRAVTVQTQSGL